MHQIYAEICLQKLILKINFSEGEGYVLDLEVGKDGRRKP